MAAELSERSGPFPPSEEIWKGVMAGAAGGLVASFVMTQFQSLTKRLTEAWEAHDEAHPADRGRQEGARPSKPEPESEDATVKTAEKLSAGVFHHELSEEEKRLAGPAVHYLFGAATGALYGGMAEVAPSVTRGAGLPFGTAVWLTADEMAVPALGLSEKPTEYPVSVHASALGAHLVYGLTTDLVRRLLRRAMS